MAEGKNVGAHKDSRLVALQQEIEQLKEKAKQLKERRITEIGRIFDKFGLTEFDDAIFYGLATELQAEKEGSVRIKELRELGEKRMPKKPGRKSGQKASAPSESPAPAAAAE